MRKEQVEFHGLTFTRYPDSPRRHHRVYYWPTKTWRERGIGALHTEIWKSVNGEIPDGWVIHHIDEDPLNNGIENLACITSSEHAKHHAEGGWGRTDPEHMARIQVLASEWHRSEEGRAWHSEHARQGWLNRQPINVGPCIVCGRPARSKVGLRKDGRHFCSNACWQRLARADGRYDHYLYDAICPVCGETFKQKKNGTPQTCSRSCGATLRNQKRAK